MRSFTDDEWAYFCDTKRAVGKDAQGRDVLVGLTLEETQFYVACVRLRDRAMSEAKARRFFGLHEKHALRRRLEGRHVACETQPMPVTIAALFDTLDAARVAVKALSKAGLSTADIQLAPVHGGEDQQCLLTIHLRDDEQAERANDAMRESGGVLAARTSSEISAAGNRTKRQ